MSFSQLELTLARPSHPLRPIEPHIAAPGAKGRRTVPPWLYSSPTSSWRRPAAKCSMKLWVFNMDFRNKTMWEEMMVVHEKR